MLFSMHILVPCVGFNTNFQNMRPKYLLADYLSRRMIELALGPYLGHYKITAIIPKEHELQYNVKHEFNDIFGDNLDIFVINNNDLHDAEVVSLCIKALNISPYESILIKSVDTFFNTDSFDSGNKIYIDSLENHKYINLQEKSWVQINNSLTVDSVTPGLVGNCFCAGAYQFERVIDYNMAFDYLSKYIKQDPTLSDVVNNLIEQGKVFKPITVRNYHEFTTQKEWFDWNNHPTIFCDIDGTIIENQTPYGPNSYGTDPKPLEKNCAKLRQALDNGCQIIFTTSRERKWYDQTRKTLDQLGFEKCTLLMDLHHAPRILINDYATTNPYPSATAINLPRNTDILDQFLTKI